MNDETPSASASSVSASAERTRELRDAEFDRVVEAERLKTAFLAALSHEFRTSLNVVLGYLDLLEEAATPAEARSLRALIRRHAGSMLGMLDNTLYLADLRLDRVVLESGSSSRFCRFCTGSRACKCHHPPCGSLSMGVLIEPICLSVRFGPAPRKRRRATLLEARGAYRLLRSLSIERPSPLGLPGSRCTSESGFAPHEPDSGRSGAPARPLGRTGAPLRA